MAFNEGIRRGLAARVEFKEMMILIMAMFEHNFFINENVKVDSN